MQTDHDPPTGGQDEEERVDAPQPEETALETPEANEQGDAAEETAADQTPTEQSATEQGATVESPPHDWEEFGLPEDRIAVLKKMGFAHPMDVQWETFVMQMEGRDLMVQSRTGSGKTAAFGLPLVTHLSTLEDKAPYALGLMPTRELAIQVADEITNIAEGSGVSVCALYGGAAIGPQIRKLEEGVQIVCGTPGRVLDHIRRGTLQVDKIHTLILDEADEMLSMGFYEELSKIISRIPNREQTLLFSATIPDEVMRLANKYMNEPERLILSEDFVGVKEIKHVYYMVSGLARPRDLMRILDAEEVESAIIFCNTREDTANIARYLRDAGRKAEAISSDFSQAERESTMQKMREKKLQYLVATDIAARGIDIAELSHVINYRFPENADIYIHRTGRTGRAGKSGVAVSLISPQELGDFYYMKLTHDIQPEERYIPTAAELAARLEGERFATLTQEIDERDESVDPEYLTLARRIWHSLRGEEIVAVLLQERFSKPRPPRPARRRPSTDEDDRRPRRLRSERRDRDGDERDRRPRRSDRRDDRRGRSDRGDRRPRSDRGDRRPRSDRGDRGDRRPRSDRGDRDRDEGKKLYLNIGRDAGVKPSSLIDFLCSNAGIERGQVHRIQIRDKFSFVNVADDVADQVVERSNGKNLGDNEVKVEHARAR